jgi:hypothetical protein
MSINLHLSGKRDVTVNKRGRRTTQEVDFSLWQTPTLITDKATASKDPRAVYAAWVYSITEDKEEPIYAEDDFFCEKPPIGTERVNEGNIHMAELDEWLRLCDEDGYTMEWFGI